ncbi:MAG: FAD-dependent oxidoreductase, partial [Salinibacter sp.]|uniref:FAD-dependent oxidoreductase n=1 Tax=Salinibacter sp. TaxID=2065818 RepID=UPI0035D3E082
FRAGTVVNAAGPWSREVAHNFDRELSDLNPCLSAWNVLFDREAPAECAVGAVPSGDGKHYFLHPWKGRVLIGTGHAPRDDKEGSPRPSPREMDDFLRKVNEAFPNLRLNREEVVSVYAGYLPAKQRGSSALAKEERWIDHSARGGPEGLFSVQGTKFTAARSTAEEGITRIFPSCTVSDEKRDTFERACAERTGERGIFDYDWRPRTAASDWQESLAQIIDEESVVHLDDLILRRTSLGDNPARALDVAPTLYRLFDWGPDRCQEEVRRIEAQFPHALESRTVYEEDE